MNNEGKNSVLVIDDEKANIIKLTHILSPEYTVYASKNGKNGVEMALKNLPDVILLDILMPEMDGYEVFRVLKNADETKEIPIIFITGLGNDADEEKGLALGAADYISKPFSPAIVKLRIQNQVRILNLIDEIKLLGVIDQLTGVSNRRSFDERLRSEWDRAKRDKTLLSIFLVDIDNFKPYNDMYGHMQGDAALQVITKIIKQSLNRSVDFIARWGGEEFAVLLPNTDLFGATSIAQNIRKTVEKTVIPCVDGESTKVTVSIGINTLTSESENTAHYFFVGADRALYAAKAMGKNKVCSYEDIGRKRLSNPS
ncbi:MAG: diguanylate cyclase [Oscillospiraceae bacterium]|nr:diguanylate cyclase [Oscillospiraceae bacterium]